MRRQFHLRPPKRLGPRALLLVPAVLLLGLGIPALAADGGSLPTPTTTHVGLGAPGAADGAVGVQAERPVGPAGPGWTGEAAVDANLVGVTWTGDPGAQFSVEARGRRGRWTSVGTVGLHDTAPDGGSPDARAAARVGSDHASEPVWIGRSDAVRVTVVGTPTPVDSVGLDAVLSLDPRVPGDSAGAWTGLPWSGPADAAFGVVLVLAGLVSAGVALGWSPWRSRRALAGLAVVGIVALAACGEPEPAPPTDTTTTSSSTTTTTRPLAPQPAIILRTTWAAGLPNQGWNPAEDCLPGPVIADGGVRFGVVHHTVNNNYYTAEQATAMVRAIWSYDVNTLGFCDIAYNFVVDAYGQIFEGRMGGITRAVVAAHAAPFNVNTMGAAFLGTFTDVQPTVAAWQSMASLFAWKLGLFGVNPRLPLDAVAGNGGCANFPVGKVVRLPGAVVGHRDVGCTACPGNALYPQMPTMLGDVATRMGY